MDETELKNDLEKYTKVLEELTNRMEILAQGGLRITNEVRNIEEYSPVGVDEPEIMENRKIYLEQQFNKLQRVYNEMNHAQENIKEIIEDILQQLNELIHSTNSRSIRSASNRSATRSTSNINVTRPTGRGISKKGKNSIKK